MTEAYNNGEFGAAGGNLLAGMAYGAMNLATLGEGRAVDSVSRGLFARLELGETNAAAQRVWALHPRSCAACGPSGIGLARHYA